MQGLHFFLHAFVYTSYFSGRSAISPEERKMNTKQTINLKFCSGWEKRMYQQVYGNNTMSCTRIIECLKRFEEQREEVNDDFRNGKPSTSRSEVIIGWMFERSQVSWSRKRTVEDYHRKFGHVEKWCQDFIIIVSCCQHGSPGPSLATRLYRTLLPVSLQGLILYRHRAVVYGS